MKYPENQLAQKTFSGNKTVMKANEVNGPTLKMYPLEAT